MVIGTTLAALPTWATLTILFSVTTNIIFIALGFVEPYKSIFSHAWKTWTHGSGKSLNVWFVTKSGAARFYYKSVDSTGKIDVKGNEYLVNPKMQVSYKGLPTQTIVEGQAEPHDYYNDQEAQKVSTNEMNRLFLNKDNGVLAWLKENMQYIMYGGIALIAVLAAIGYFLYDIQQVVSALETTNKVAANATNIPPNT
jgi:hypothetical protein